MKDLTLQVWTIAEDYVEKDTSCDSTFMMNIIEEMGESIREAFHWVPRSKSIHLFMDNAGGHGTELAKMEYINILKTHFNVEVIWQVSNSPKTNILELGVWCLLQSLVEYLHRRQRMSKDSLARTVEQAWELVDGSTKFYAVHERWKKVLSLIVLGGGGNSLVERCRGIRKPLDDVVLLLLDRDEYESDDDVGEEDDDDEMEDS